MGNERADAIRAALREAVLERYGTLDVAATQLGIAYKTLYRHLTVGGKDRTARVPLDFVLDVGEVLGLTLSDLADRGAALRLSADAPTVASDVMDIADSIDTSGETKRVYDRAAQRKSRHE